MIRPPFMRSPWRHIWTPREITDRARYGCAIEVGRRSIWDRLIRILKGL